MSAQSAPLLPGTYRTEVAGLVVGVVDWPSEPGQLCQATICAYAEGVQVKATGGNAGAFSRDWTNWSGGFANSFVLPVQPGIWEIAVFPTPGSVAVPPCRFFWHSLAPDSNADLLPIKVSEETLNIHRRSHPAPMRERVDAHREDDIEKLIDALEVVFERQVPPPYRRLLVEIITRI